MDWEAIGAIGELIGAIAVVATLAYLAIQIRQNTHSMEESRKLEMSRHNQMRTQQRLELLDSVLGSDVLLGVWARTSDGGWPEVESVINELTEIERAAYRAWLRKQVLIVENIYAQHMSGLIDEEIVENTIPLIKRQLPVWRELNALSGARPSFIEFVESVTLQD